MHKNSLMALLLVFCSPAFGHDHFNLDHYLNGLLVQFEPHSLIIAALMVLAFALAINRFWTLFKWKRK